MVERIYVEKKPGFSPHVESLRTELHDVLGIKGLTGLRVLNRYDVEGADKALFDASVIGVFSEPQVDVTYRTLDEVLAAENAGAAGAGSTNGASGADGSAWEPAAVFAVEPLPGQFDQRADSAAECMLLIGQEARPDVSTATVYVLEGDLSEADIAAVQQYVINPVEAREAQLDPVDTLDQGFPEPDDVEVLDGFLELDEAGLEAFIADRGLAMDLGDITFLQQYFRDEGRAPTITEVKMVDTYWSDHCRHTTFGTQLTEMQIDDPAVQAAYDMYLSVREELGRAEKPICLMDMGTIGAKALKETGELTGLDESEEINACTVRCKVDVRGEEQDWLYLFKNETHNHPTEIEPFGGAATCLGGAIRDPLSGRAYVYQAMRVTGAADPTAPLSDTLAGKLPQRKLCITAAEGYSSYGNQIGLATGQVNELYHPGYAAKRMEIGAVVGATPASDVRRETPAPGDVVVLLGGRTGRDGIGGATGSSKAHSASSIETCGAEVQKGNPPVERKIQRLFRNSEACRMIKRCNDFGAGGVSVAIGELADGLEIDLDAVPLKYAGLDGTEIAISESQERMAVALAPEDVERFCELAREENMEATPVARVTAEPRVRMNWRGNTIVDVSRAFLASNGAPKEAQVHVGQLGSVDELNGQREAEAAATTLADLLSRTVADLNVASNKGLAERFDSTIGAATVLMPFGGEQQLTPAQAMVAKFPVLGGQTTTVSGLAWGFNPYLSERNPFHGAYIAVLESIAKLVATGFERRSMYLTFQEYFAKLGDDPARWGQPVAALLGALQAQLAFGVGAIGGKDSMSGSFEDLNVPPTLVSFATAVGNIDRITSPELKRTGTNVVWLCTLSDMPDDIRMTMDTVERLIGDGKVLACATVGYAGLVETIFKMCVGNGIGVALGERISLPDLSMLNYGTFVVELAEGETVESIMVHLQGSGFAAVPDDAPVDWVVNDEGNGCEMLQLGVTTPEYRMVLGDETVDLADVQETWEGALEGVFPYRTAAVEAAEGAGAGATAAVEGAGVGAAEGADGTVGAEGAASAAPSAQAQEVPTVSYTAGPAAVFNGPAVARPRVVIPVFPGNNCEYDTLAAFDRAGAEVITQVINDLSPDAVRQSTELLVENIRRAQIVMLPGGFSGGDEPDGSAKLITSFFRAPAVAEAVRDLLKNRDGLMLGICNGFQALVKLGLVPYGDIVEPTADSPTLTFNRIGRHQSQLVRTRVASNLSPWLAECPVGSVHTIAISHGEGRFVAPDAVLDDLVMAGQVATQYVDADGVPSMDLSANPNGSMLAIEGITSPDGRVLGKMGHTERAGDGLYKNVPGDRYQPLFEAGVRYFQ